MRDATEAGSLVISERLFDGFAERVVDGAKEQAVPAAVARDTYLYGDP